MTALKRMFLKYGGGCAVCHGWIPEGEEAYYDNGQLIHLDCMKGPETFEADVLDRLAELHDCVHRIEDKLVSLGYAPGVTADIAMGGKK